MPVAQSIRIREILQKHFGDNEEARAVVSAIEAVVEEKATEKQTASERLLNRDLELLKADLKIDIANMGSKIAESKVDLIKWSFSFFATLTLLIIGLYLK